MGNFSRDTFNKLKHYVGVRLQQGVPIVDADWNELEDIRKYELQAFLKWYVGNGIPNGNDGFHISPAFIFRPLPTPHIEFLPNDFVIKGGDGTPEGAGRCLVEGWDVINESNLKYTDQRLFKEAGLDEAWDVAPLPALTTPTSARTDTVYLDVWEREVNAAEDFDQLVNPAIGIETCMRLRREWVVRVAEGANAPPAAPQGHVFYTLAQLNRPANAAAITAEHIVDRRLTGLTVISQHDIDQIVTDAYGSTYTLDHDGQPNLKVSLRDAINALLRGALPSTPEYQVTQDTTYKEKPIAIKDNQAKIWLFWSGGSDNWDIWCKQYQPDTGQWSSDQQLTTDPAYDSTPFVLPSRQGGIWLFWRSNRTGAQGSASIWYKRFNPVTNTWGQDSPLTTTSGQDQDYNPYALEDSQGNLWVFWQRYENYNNQNSHNIWYKKYDRATNSWGNDSRLTTDPALDQNPVAAEDSSGNIWVFWSSYRQNGNLSISNTYYRRYSNQQWDTQDNQLTYESSQGSGSYAPFVLRDNTGNLFVFWYAIRDQNYDIWYKKLSANSWSGEIRLTSDPSYDFTPFAFQDDSGDIWVFWQSYRSGNYDIWYKRYSEGGGWGRDLALTTDNSQNSQVSALQDPAGDIAVFWLRAIYGQFEEYQVNIWQKRLIPVI